VSSYWTAGFNVDDYVGNFRKLYLHFALTLSGERVSVDNAYFSSHLEVPAAASRVTGST